MQVFFVFFLTAPLFRHKMEASAATKRAENE